MCLMLILLIYMQLYLYYRLFFLFYSGGCSPWWMQWKPITWHVIGRCLLVNLHDVIIYNDYLFCINHDSRLDDMRWDWWPITWHVIGMMHILLIYLQLYLCCLLFLLCYSGGCSPWCVQWKTYYGARNRFHLLGWFTVNYDKYPANVLPLKSEVSGVLLHLLVALPITWHVIGFACFHIIWFSSGVISRMGENR